MKCFVLILWSVAVFCHASELPERDNFFRGRLLGGNVPIRMSRSKMHPSDSSGKQIVRISTLSVRITDDLNNYYQNLLPGNSWSQQQLGHNFFMSHVFGKNGSRTEHRRRKRQIKSEDFGMKSAEGKLAVDYPKRLMYQHSNLPPYIHTEVVKYMSPNTDPLESLRKPFQFFSDSAMIPKMLRSPVLFNMKPLSISSNMAQARKNVFVQNNPVIDKRSCNRSSKKNRSSIILVFGGNVQPKMLSIQEKNDLIQNKFKEQALAKSSDLSGARNSVKKEPCKKNSSALVLLFGDKLPKSSSRFQRFPQVSDMMTKPKVEVMYNYHVIEIENPEKSNKTACTILTVASITALTTILVLIILGSISFFCVDCFEFKYPQTAPKEEIMCCGVPRRLHGFHDMIAAEKVLEAVTRVLPKNTVPKDSATVVTV